MFWLKSIARLCLDAFAVQIALPFVITAGGVVIGIQWAVNPFYLYVGSVLLFAGAASGLLRFSEWRFRNQVKDKLAFDFVRVFYVVGGAGYVTEMKFGIQLKSNAHFPISFQVDSVYSEFIGCVPPRKNLDKSEIVIPAWGIGLYDDHNIQLNITEKLEGSCIGKIRIKFKYGKPGKLKHDIHVDQLVYVLFDKDGLYQRHDAYQLTSNSEKVTEFNVPNRMA